MTDREVMQMALEALEKTMSAWGGTCAWHRDVKIAITALRARLAEPAPMPNFAWADWWRDHGQYNFHATSRMTFERAKELMKLAFEVGRETAPPALAAQYEGCIVAEQEPKCKRAICQRGSDGYCAVCHAEMYPGY